MILGISLGESSGVDSPRRILLNIESGRRPVQEQGDRAKDLDNLANSHGLTVLTLALA